MQGLGAALKRLAAGDLDQKLADGFSADYASVRDDLNLAIAKLKDAMLEVVACADAVRVGRQPDGERLERSVASHRSAGLHP